MPTSLESSGLHIYSVVFDRSTTDGDPEGSFFGVDDMAFLASSSDTGVITPPPLGHSESSAPMTIGWSPIQNFGITNGQFGDIVLYDRELTAVEQALVVEHLRNKYALLQHATWMPDSGGNWNNVSHWVGDHVPNGPGINVFLADIISTTRTIFTDTAITIGNLRFNNENQYVVAGLGSINFDSPLPNAHIDVLAGNHQFQVAVNLLTKVDVDVADGSLLSFNGALNLNGQMLNKTGQGTLAINNHLSMGGGSVTISEGTLSGGGTAGGDIHNHGGVLSPGESLGTLSVVRNDTATGDTATGDMATGDTATGDMATGIPMSDALMISAFMPTLTGEIIVGESPEDLEVPEIHFSDRQQPARKENSSWRDAVKDFTLLVSQPTGCAVEQYKHKSDLAHLVYQCFESLDLSQLQVVSWLPSDH